MLPWRVLLTIIGIYVPLNFFIIFLTWWPPTVQPEIPSWVTPGVATGIIVGGIIYWVVFAKIMPWLGFHIDSQPDELVDGSRIVTYKVHLPGSHRRITQLTISQRYKTGAALKMANWWGKHMTFKKKNL